MFRMFKNKVVPVAVISVLTFITLSTSVMALSKIFGSFGHGGVGRGDSVSEKVVDQKRDSLTEAPKNNSGLTPTSVQKVPTSVPSTQIIVTSSPTINSNNCIVTVFGKQYDVTSLRGSHSGGDIFNCGTDMTTIYQNHHGANTSLIAPYLITGAGITNSPQNAQPTGKRSRRVEDDD